jgi:uncharacterized delta-60 repeat protein
MFGLAMPAFAEAWFDPTFGEDGKVSTAFGEYTTDEVRDLAIQADGKIIAVGSANETDTSYRRGFGLARYLEDGSPDLSFSGDGRVLTFLTRDSDAANAVAIQPDGRILVGGQGSISYKSRFALARYDADGALDETFGVNGSVLTSFERDESLILDLALQADGGIVVAGRTRTGSDSDVALARYTADGALDASFSGDGIEVTQVGAASTGAVALEILPDGKLLVAAAAYSPPYHVYLLRYLPDGALDPTFGQAGIVAVDMGGQATLNDMALQRDGKILLAGMRPDGFGVTRTRADGAVDTAFGIGGAAIASMLNGVTRVLQDRSGNVLVAGRYLPASGSDFAVARFKANGALDTSFGDNGAARVNWGDGEQSIPWAMQVDAKGRIVLGGATGAGTRADFGLARLIAPVAPVGSVWLPLALR